MTDEQAQAFWRRHECERLMSEMKTSDLIRIMLDRQAAMQFNVDRASGLALEEVQQCAADEVDERIPRRRERGENW